MKAGGLDLRVQKLLLMRHRPHTGRSSSPSQSEGGWAGPYDRGPAVLHLNLPDNMRCRRCQ